MRIERIVMMTDLEGVAGVVSFDAQTRSDAPFIEQARLLLTAEVNAAVEGMLEAGVHDILVIDGHGPGGIHFETLHPEVRLMHGRPISLARECAALLPHYQATCMIGQHAMAGVADGTMNHTQSSTTVAHYRLNGREIGEIAQWALFAGAFRVPTIYLTGDRAACREAEDLIPGITTTEVKQGLSRSAAISLSAPKARELIRQGARKAVETQNSTPVAPPRWPGPHILEKRYLFTGGADAYRGHRLLHRIVDSRTVELQADAVEELMYE